MSSKQYHQQQQQPNGISKGLSGNELGSLQTEGRNPASALIDRVSTLEMVQAIHREDTSVAATVEPCLGDIAEAIDALTKRVRLGGRVFYIGAGTSGRLGVLDASEIPPTYSVPSDRFVALIAGGDGAIRHAVEGAEDDRSAAVRDLDSFQLDPETDSVIGIASSGRTPYVLGGLAHANALGCVTVGIVCVQPSALEAEGNAHFVIAPVTGPEIVTGSTRMKAGTATKMALNMISTGIMIKVGKTYGNMMVDMKCSNFKLRQRSKNILRFVGGSLCSQSDEELEKLLQDCDGSVKLAAATIILQTSIVEARKSLERNNGVLAGLIEEASRQSMQNGHAQGEGGESFVVAVDAGGSSCKAVIMDSSGQAWIGEGKPCNVSRVGVSTAMSIVSDALQRAVDAHPILAGKPFRALPISSVWVGMAGYDRPAVKPLIRSGLIKMLRIEDTNKLQATADVDLLAASVADQPGVDSVIVLIVGTGSVAMSFKRQDRHRFSRTARVGGWGPLLGDEGSGYWVGNEGLRVALEATDLGEVDGTGPGPEGQDSQHLGDDPLVKQITAQFAVSYPDSGGDLLDVVRQAPAGAQGHTNDPFKNIANFTKIVFDTYTTSPAAKTILESGARSLAKLVTSLITKQHIDPSNTALVLAGGLTQNETYRQLIDKHLSSQGINFPLVYAVQQPAMAAAESLRREAQDLN
ncbi:putative glucokinase regulator family protein [Mariannaea sp. PMI_226]|nr:putative glucokinase regulator family protein [Mariannaea sp. PMI_226]